MPEDTYYEKWLIVVETGRLLGFSDRGTKAKSITSCDNVFVTNIVLARDPGAINASETAHQTPPGSFALCESEAIATNVFCSESEATATNVFCAKAKRQQQMFSVRKRSVSNKAPSRNGNQPLALLKNYTLLYRNSHSA